MAAGAHYQAGFKEKSLEEKAALGLRPTKDVLHRAQLCTSCHVGTKDKEVNHDLIAAGHPRLAFELGGYHGIYNKHWDINKDHERYPDFEARLWSVGQLTSAKAALELLAARAAGASKSGKESKPWPEFSEYNCFACHTGLTVSDLGSDRQKLKFANRKPGNLPWGEWYFSPTNPLSGQVGMRAADDADPLHELRNSMQSPSPNADKVGGSVKGIVNRINDVLGSLQPGRLVDGGRPRATLEHVLHVGKQRAPGMSWDEAAQLYLALAAMENELSDVDRREATEAVKRRLRKMAGDLQKAFPPGSDSPSLFQPSLLETDLTAIREKFRN